VFVHPKSILPLRLCPRALWVSSALSSGPTPLDTKCGLTPSDARPLPVPARETTPLEARRPDIQPNTTAPRHAETPIVDLPPSPPKRSAEGEVDSAHKCLRNNTGTATVRPTQESTPLHAPEDLNGPGHYPPSAWDAQYGHNYGPSRHFGGPYYHPGYAPPPNWGRPPGYPNYSDHMSYSEHPHHRQDTNDGYGPYPVNAYHQGGPPPHFFPPQHYPTNPHRGRTPSEHSSKKDDKDDA